MTSRRVAGGALAVAVATGGGVAAHQAGLFDDAVRAGSRAGTALPDRLPPRRQEVPEAPVPDVPVPRPRVTVAPEVPGRGPVNFPAIPVPSDDVDALLEGYVPLGLKESIRLVRAWRNGDDMERAFAKTSCKFLSLAVDGEPGQDAWENALRQDFAATQSGRVAEVFANRYAPKIANAMWLAQRNSRAALWYFQHCAFP